MTDLSLLVRRVNLVLTEKLLTRVLSHPTTLLHYKGVLLQRILLTPLRLLAKLRII